MAKFIPVKWSWLYKETGPRMLVEALRHYGELEHPGPGSNPNISAWAKELGVGGWYTDDDIPWCGLFVGICAKRAGYDPPKGLKQLGAMNWQWFGQPVGLKDARLWDILIFKRTGGGHVGFYVGENDHAFLVYGGNQSNAVGFAWIAKSRLVAVRKPVYKIGEPKNVRKIILTETGELSRDESFV